MRETPGEPVCGYFWQVLSRTARTPERKLAFTPGSVINLPQVLLDCGLQIRQDVEQIGNKAVIRYLEDRRFLVLVDRNNDL